jgi:hypothetical protein
MNNKLRDLGPSEIKELLNRERKKFLVALDYGSPYSHLEEIRQSIKELEMLINMFERNLRQHEPEKRIR